jgi:hypothetical protein
MGAVLYDWLAAPCRDEICLDVLEAIFLGGSPGW